MGKRRITIDDLFTIKLVADPNISPDGERVAFVVTSVDKESNGYKSAIWMARSDQEESPYQFTSGRQQDHSPRWSPDGSHLAFISNRSGKNQIHVMPTGGGEPWQVTDGPNPAADPAWLPDGKGLIYVTKVEPESVTESDTKVIRSLFHKLDGEGYWDGKYRHIHVAGIDGGEPRQITDGEWDSMQPAVSPDGRTVAFVSYREEDRESTRKSDIWLCGFDGGDLRRVTDADGAYGTPSWSPDGTKLAYTGHPVVEPYGPTTLDDLFVWDIGSDEATRLLSDLDREPGNSAMSDMRFHVPNQRPLWLPDGGTLLTLISDEGSVHVFRCPVSGERTGIVTGPRDVQSFTVANNGTVAFAAASMTQPTEVFVADERDGGERQVSFMNDDLLKELELATVGEIRFESDPGVQVHGWLLQPPGMQQEAKYPAIVQVHGGPHGMYGVGFFHEMQLLAARGYVVLMTNPRGSTGYGQEWVAGTLGDWGGADYRDVLAGADALAALDSVDPARIGITGGSYGGYMTNWAIGQTDRFKAAVSQRSTANRISLYGTSDINWSYNDWEYNGTPYENPDFYRERSPLTYVENVTTPLLLIHSENDLRCPISQSEEFFTALKKFGRTVEFVRFPDESHGMSRSGQPKHRVERLERMCAWFDLYL